MTDTDPAAWTAERPASGLVVHQPRKGFRYGAEAFWLAGVVLLGGVPATALDLGTGSGIVAWLLARHGADVRAVDVRPEWAPGWARSVEASQVAGVVRYERAGVQELLRPVVQETVDVVVSNPPFFPAGTGPRPADAWRDAARFETEATLAEFVAAGLAHLGPLGRLVMVVPVEREADLLAAVPAGWGAAQVLRVGRRRVVVEVRAGCAHAAPVAIVEDGPEAKAWYAAATGPVGGEVPCPT